MEQSEVVEISVLWSQSGVVANTFKTILYFAVIDGTEEGVTWPVDQIYKDYTDPADIDSDFYEGHRVRLAATAWSRQAPKAKTLRVVKYDGNQAEADQLNAIPQDWVILTGLQDTPAVNAATWIETRKDKMQFTMSCREDFGATHPFDQMLANSCRNTMGTWNKGAGTLLTNITLEVAANVATVKGNSTAKVERITIDTATTGEKYSITYLGVKVEYTAQAAETVSDIRDALKALLDAEATFTDDLTIANNLTDSIDFTAINKGKDFTLTIVALMSSEVLTPNSNAAHNSDIGDKVLVLGSSITAANGYHTITATPDTDELQFACVTDDATDNTGDATADCAYDAMMDVGLASLACGYEMGEIDLAHKPIEGAKPTPDAKFKTIRASLEALKANWYWTLGTDDGFYNGLTFGNKYSDTILGIGIWYPWYLQSETASYMKSGKSRGFGEATFTGALAVMNSVSEETQKERLLTDSFEANLSKYPENDGYPPGVLPGMHYINHVPKKSDFSAAVRQDRRAVKSGFKSYIQSRGGIHGISLVVNVEE